MTRNANLSTNLSTNVSTNLSTNLSTADSDSALARDWLDGLLDSDARDERSSYITDDGFTARVMRALPATLALPAWRKPAVVALWGVALAGISFALPGAALDVAREAYRLLGAHPVSLSGMAGALLFAGALSWSAAAYALRTSE
jgi:hypothetical protein